MDTLFHYTDARGLLGILSAPSLWASDLRFLNDAQEAVYARDLVIDAVRSMPNPVRDPGHWAHQHGDAAIETFARYQAMVVEYLQQAEFGVFVACFCEAGDLLSQWRGYGQDHGYALEIRAEALQAAVSKIPSYPGATGLFKVRYGQATADAVVQQAMAELAGFNLNHPGVKAHYSALAINSLLAQLKHPGFEEEAEWRLVVGLEILDETQFAQVGARTLFRATQMAIVPYIDIPLDRSAIVGIRVGPGGNVEVREAGVRRLVTALGMDVAISRSEVPLRT